MARPSTRSQDGAPPSTRSHDSVPPSTTEHPVTAISPETVLDQNMSSSADPRQESNTRRPPQNTSNVPDLVSPIDAAKIIPAAPKLTSAAANKQPVAAKPTPAVAHNKTIAANKTATVVKTIPAAASNTPAASQLNPKATKSGRVMAKLQHLTDYVCHTSSTSHPIEPFLSYIKLQPQFRAAILATYFEVEPQNYAEASQFKHWLLAMDNETKALEQNNTWVITKLPPGHKAIGYKWVYKVKYNEKREVVHFKARLVAKGYNQRQGIDYSQTYAPVAKFNTLKVFLALAAMNNWNVHQLDINNAFLHEDLHEEVYIKIPPGYKAPPNTVYKLNKSIYGQQASRQWLTNLVELFLHMVSNNPYQITPCS
uniref:Reverse transcriptase Ty1/copia-type domain-containing protein n=1 Tax=Cannabis sativa TaxID=3483 RepID=A0A803Q7S7_CANSA